MKFTEEVQNIKKLQDNLVEVQSNIRAGCKKLKKQITKLVNKKLADSFPGVKFYWLVGVDGGCMTNRWEPEIYFYTVNNLQLSPKGFWYDDDIDKFEKTKPPVPTKKLLAFLKDLSIELGVTCRMIRREPYWVHHRADANLLACVDNEDY